MRSPIPPPKPFPRLPAAKVKGDNKALAKMRDETIGRNECAGKYKMRGLWRGGAKWCVFPADRFVAVATASRRRRKFFPRTAPARERAPAAPPRRPRRGLRARQWRGGAAHNQCQLAVSVTSGTQDKNKAARARCRDSHCEVGAFAFRECARGKRRSTWTRG